MRQIRKALGKNQLRVKRAIISLSSQGKENIAAMVNKNYKGTLALTTSYNDLAFFLKPLPTKEITLKQGAIFLVDPLGNVITGTCKKCQRNCNFNRRSY